MPCHFPTPPHILQYVKPIAPCSTPRPPTDVRARSDLATVGGWVIWEKKITCWIVSNIVLDMNIIFVFIYGRLTPIAGQPIHAQVAASALLCNSHVPLLLAAINPVLSCNIHYISCNLDWIYCNISHVSLWLIDWNIPQILWTGSVYGDR